MTGWRSLSDRDAAREAFRLLPELVDELPAVADGHIRTACRSALHATIPSALPSLREGRAAEMLSTILVRLMEEGATVSPAAAVLPVLELARLAINVLPPNASFEERMNRGVRLSAGFAETMRLAFQEITAQGGRVPALAQAIVSNPLIFLYPATNLPPFHEVATLLGVPYPTAKAVVSILKEVRPRTPDPDRLWAEPWSADILFLVLPQLERYVKVEQLVRAGLDARVAESWLSGDPALLSIVPILAEAAQIRGRWSILTRLIRALEDESSLPAARHLLVPRMQAVEATVVAFGLGRLRAEMGNRTFFFPQDVEEIWAGLSRGRPCLDMGNSGLIFFENPLEALRFLLTVPGQIPRTMRVPLISVGHGSLVGGTDGARTRICGAGIEAALRWQYSPRPGGIFLDPLMLDPLQAALKTQNITLDAHPDARHIRDTRKVFMFEERMMVVHDTPEGSLELEILSLLEWDERLGIEDTEEKNRPELEDDGQLYFLPGITAIEDEPAPPAFWQEELSSVGAGSVGAGSVGAGSVGAGSIGESRGASAASLGGSSRWSSQEEYRYETKVEPKSDSYSGPRVTSPKVESPKVESPKVESPKVESPRVESPRVESPRVESPRVEPPKIEPRPSLPPSPPPMPARPPPVAPPVAASAVAPSAPSSVDDIFAWDPPSPKTGQPRSSTGQAADPFLDDWNFSEQDDAEAAEPDTIWEDFIPRDTNESMTQVEEASGVFSALESGLESFGQKGASIDSAIVMDAGIVDDEDPSTDPDNIVVAGSDTDVAMDVNWEDFFGPAPTPAAKPAPAPAPAAKPAPAPAPAAKPAPAPAPVAKPAPAPAPVAKPAPAPAPVAKPAPAPVAKPTPAPSPAPAAKSPWDAGGFDDLLGDGVIVDDDEDDIDASYDVVVEDETTDPRGRPPPRRSVRQNGVPDLPDFNGYICFTRANQISFGRRYGQQLVDFHSYPFRNAAEGYRGFLNDKIREGFVPQYDRIHEIPPGVTTRLLDQALLEEVWVQMFRS